VQSLTSWPVYLQDMLVLAIFACVLVTLVCRMRHAVWARYKWLGLLIGIITAAAPFTIHLGLSPHGTLQPLGQSLLIAWLGATAATVMFMLLPWRRAEWRHPDDLNTLDLDDLDQTTAPAANDLADQAPAALEAAPVSVADNGAIESTLSMDDPGQSDIELAVNANEDDLSFDQDDLDPRILDESLDLTETEAIYRTLRDQPVLVDLPDDSVWPDLDDTADHSRDFGDSLLPPSATRATPPPDVADTSGAVRQAAIEAEILEGEFVRTANQPTKNPVEDEHKPTAAEQVIAAQKQLLDHAHRKNRKLEVVIQQQKKRIERHRQQAAKARHLARDAARAARLAAQQALAANNASREAKPASTPNRETARQRPVKPMRRTPELSKLD